MPNAMTTTCHFACRLRATSCPTSTFRPYDPFRRHWNAQRSLTTTSAATASSASSSSEQDERIQHPTNDASRMHALRALHRQVVAKGHAPRGISLTGDRGWPDPEHPFFVRAVGTCRHAYWRQARAAWGTVNGTADIDTDAMEGIIYRLQALARSDALSSVLVSSNLPGSNNHAECLPLSVLENNDFNSNVFLETIVAEPLDFGKPYLQLAGYDPSQLLIDQRANDEENNKSPLTQASRLALAHQDRSSKVPVVTVWDGILQDAGAALAHATYVLATPQARLECTRPNMGLSFDPVGFSCPSSWKQAAADQKSQHSNDPMRWKYNSHNPNGSTAAWLWAIGGWPCRTDDLLATGWATHAIHNTHSLGLLEHTLSELPPWNQQAMLKEPVRMMGDTVASTDFNHEHRNRSVAEAIHSFAAYRGDGRDVWTLDDADVVRGDPSLVWDKVDHDDDLLPMHEERSSLLLDLAAAVDLEWGAETSLVGRVDILRQVAARTPSDLEEKEGVAAAQRLVNHIDRQSPLALHAVHELLVRGATSTMENLETCMARERIVQANLLWGEEYDFSRWKKQNDDNGTPIEWRHKSIKDVTNDEVTEVFHNPQAAQRQGNFPSWVGERTS